MKTGMHVFRVLALFYQVDCLSMKRKALHSLNVFNLCLLDCAKIDQLDVTCCWALKNEIIKQVTSSWSIFIQLSLTIQVYQLTLHNDLNLQQHSCESLKYCKFKHFLLPELFVFCHLNFTHAKCEFANCSWQCFPGLETRNVKVINKIDKMHQVGFIYKII